MHRPGWIDIVAASAFAALLVPGCGRGRPSPPPSVPEVAIVAVQPERIVLTTELPGRTSPFLIAEIRPQVSGILKRRHFTEGADVKAGELLYEIDPSPYRAAFDRAKAAVAGARAEHTVAVAAVAAARAGHATAVAARDAARIALESARAEQTRAEATAVPLRLRNERYQELVKSKAVSQQECDDVAAALKQAEAGIIRARAAVRGAEAEIQRAEAAVGVAEADIQRAEAAVQGAKAAIQSAEAAEESARINLDYTKITAPISGRIGRSTVTTGALVTAHQPLALATIQQLDPMYVDVPQSTTEMLRLQRRLADGRLTSNGTVLTDVRLILEDGTAYPVEGTLQFRDVSVDPTTGSVILRMVFPNPNATLLPGMFVRTVVKEGVNEEAILVLQQAVSRNTRGDPLVWILDARDQPQPRMLTLDRALGDRWLVTDGLAPGDRVIVEGWAKVQLAKRMQKMREKQGLKSDLEVRSVPFTGKSARNASPDRAAPAAPGAAPESK